MSAGYDAKMGRSVSGLSVDRPSEVVLAARAARQYYLEGLSKVDIADPLGISRFRVARRLDRRAPKGYTAASRLRTSRAQIQRS